MGNISAGADYKKGLYQQQHEQQLWKCGCFIGHEGILFFQNKVSYQHNMVAKVLVNHIELFYFEMEGG
jgi:hypothetical protein